ncbi:hypothetical protein JCM19047_3944 [Bacillus sp. JCM 19047]|nr:hypothetical protein JCM19047_3944 [Bacillus sp. JCM 19047]
MTTNLLIQAATLKVEDIIKKYRLSRNKSSKKMKAIISNPLATRMDVAAQLAEQAWSEFEASPRTKRKQAILPAKKYTQALESLADYILAEDLAQGLAIKRTPRTSDAVEAELRDRPKMGEGAMKYEKLVEEGAWCDSDRVKTCEMCGFLFLDTTKPRNKKRCGASCDKEYERRRKRSRTDKKRKEEQGITVAHGDSRYKRERERQQLEYGFYSPWELVDIQDFAEPPTAPESFEYGEIARKSRVMDEHFRLEGRVTAKVEVSDDWIDDKMYHYKHRTSVATCAQKQAEKQRLKEYEKFVATQPVVSYILPMT